MKRSPIFLIVAFVSLVIAGMLCSRATMTENVLESNKQPCREDSCIVSHAVESNDEDTVTQRWLQAVACPDSSVVARMELAHRLSYEKHIDEDTVAVYLLQEDLLGKYIDESRGVIILNTAGDGRAVMLTIEDGGTMKSGTTYILYKTKNNRTTIKKVAYAEPDPEGGVCFPACFQKIKRVKGGYRMYGVFAFDSQSEAYHDRKYIRRSDLEHDRNKKIIKVK